VSVNPTYAFTQNLELDIQPSLTAFIFTTTVRYPLNTVFAPSTLSDFLNFFNQSTLALLNIPLSSALLSSVENERQILRNAQLSTLNMTFGVQLEYLTSTDLLQNLNPQDAHFFILVVGQENRSLLQSVANLHQYGSPWGIDTVQGRQVRLYWVFIAILIALFVSLILATIAYFRGKRDGFREKYTSTDRLFS